MADTHNGSFDNYLHLILIIAQKFTVYIILIWNAFLTIAVFLIFLFVFTLTAIKNYLFLSFDSIYLKL